MQSDPGFCCCSKASGGTVLVYNSIHVGANSNRFVLFGAIEIIDGSQKFSDSFIELFGILITHIVVPA